MKYFALFVLFFFIISCNNNKSVYWCGDHACINKKEKDAYFKKTMVVEIKSEKNIQYKDKSEINKIFEQAKLNEKKRLQKEKFLIKDEKLEEKIHIKSEKALAKQAKIDEKRRIKSEKALAKQAKIDEKRRIKSEIALAKQAKIDEKRLIKEEKKLFKQRKIAEKKLSKNNNSKDQKKMLLEINEKNAVKEIISTELNTFSQIVKKIRQRNLIKDYPDINNLPN